MSVVTTFSTRPTTGHIASLKKRDLIILFSTLPNRSGSQIGVCMILCRLSFFPFLFNSSSTFNYCCSHGIVYHPSLSFHVFVSISLIFTCGPHSFATGSASFFLFAQ
ncbi:hypothetical protein BDZ97DRAFT_243584 [Flammula alnicola]|nr:hypothetical protein BDZ97DRAFT_243584 [Flammula alnicola]